MIVAATLEYVAFSGRVDISMQGIDFVFLCDSSVDENEVVLLAVSRCLLKGLDRPFR